MTNSLGYLVQLQRLITATKLGCAKPYQADVKNAILKMRRTQVVFTLMHTVSIAPTLVVAIGILPPYWFVAFILMSFETSATTFTFVTFSLNRLRKQKKRADAKSRRAVGTDEGGGQVGDKVGDDTSTSPMPGAFGSSVVVDVVPANPVE